jgi:uncharacterized protein (DUF305 family)
MKPLLACLALACVLAASGCNANSRSDGRVALGLATDSAYLTVLAAQNRTAVAYSQAIMRAKPSKQVSAFAVQVITSRAKEAKKILELQSEDTQKSDFTLPDAAAQLGRSLAHLGITADGKPLAAPSTDAGYIAAMTANDKAVLKSSSVNTDHGSPGVVPFAKDVILQRTSELETLRNLPQ